MPSTSDINKTTVQKGKWVNFDSLLVDGFCDRPCEVTRTTESRVFYIGRNSGDEHYKALTSIVFVSDTKEEAEALYDLSRNQCLELRKVRAEHKERAQALLSRA